MSNSINPYFQHLNRSSVLENSLSRQNPSVKSVENKTAELDGTVSSKSHSVHKSSEASTVDQSQGLDLSKVAQNSLSDPSFDQNKVDAIKNALRDGNYPLDSKKIAESFLSLERLLSD